MHIAGGIYRELCDVPRWNAEYGSGGRAAAAVSSLSPGSSLHTYARNPDSDGIRSLRVLGIDVQAAQSNCAITFAYFHSLSDPHVEPPLDSIVRQHPIEVRGDVVLRFGFLEGDAVVTARRAIYDPQTPKVPASFGENGSTANELALVMNELELRQFAATDDLNVGAARALLDPVVSVLVVKAGAKGAHVFDRGAGHAFIPAYRSQRVFKIGTGDVFSALFAFHWGEAGMPAHHAADLASRSVAAYCDSPRLPLGAKAAEGLSPIEGFVPTCIWLEGSTTTIGRRYTLEELRFRLTQLGATVVCPALDTGACPDVEASAVMLVVDDGMTNDIRDRARHAITRGVEVVLLNEHRSECGVTACDLPGCTSVDDFSSALYLSIWAAMRRLT